MPASLQDSNARVGRDGRSVLADGGGADTHEVTEVVIEGIELRDLPRSQPLDIGQCQTGRRIEPSSRRLDGHDEARLLAEVGDHRYLVAVYCGDAHHPASGAIREG